MWDRPGGKRPPIVTFCIEMWQRLNPDWAVRVFSGEEARAQIVPEVPGDVWDELRPQFQSDLLRTKLLATQGGVWADASLLPHRPLNEIVAHCEATDLAAIPTRHPGRVIANGFMAGGAGGSR